MRSGSALAAPPPPPCAAPVRAPVTEFDASCGTYAYAQNAITPRVLPRSDTVMDLAWPTLSRTDLPWPALLPSVSLRSAKRHLSCGRRRHPRSPEYVVQVSGRSQASTTDAACSFRETAGMLFPESRSGTVESRARDSLRNGNVISMFRKQTGIAPAGWREGAAA